jgi:hypothetical protein
MYHAATSCTRPPRRGRQRQRPPTAHSPTRRLQQSIYLPTSILHISPSSHNSCTGARSCGFPLDWRPHSLCFPPRIQPRSCAVCVIETLTNMNHVSVIPARCPRDPLSYSHDGVRNVCELELHAWTCSLRPVAFPAPGAVPTRTRSLTSTAPRGMGPSPPRLGFVRYVQPPILRSQGCTSAPDAGGSHPVSPIPVTKAADDISLSECPFYLASARCCGWRVLCLSMILPYRNTTRALLTHPRQPLVTGTSVLGIKFDGGVMLAADNLGG